MTRRQALQHRLVRVARAIQSTQAFQPKLQEEFQKFFAEGKKNGADFSGGVKENTAKLLEIIQEFRSLPRRVRGITPDREAVIVADLVYRYFFQLGRIEGLTLG